MSCGTVPWRDVSVFLVGAPAATVTAAQDAAVRVGANVELDAAAFSLADPAAAVALGRWCAANDEAFARWSAGGEFGQSVTYRLPVRHARAVDSGGVRSFLAADHAALCRLGAFGPVLAELTNAKPDPAVLSDAAALGVRLSGRGDRRAAIEFAFCGVDVPAELGGAWWRGELRRHVALDVSYATWRDRPNRRLVAVSVHADQMFVDPARFSPWR